MLSLATGLAVSLACQRPVGAEPASAATEPPREYYLQEPGYRVPFQPVYEGWFGSQRYPPNALRATVENVALLGLEVALYWSDPSSNFVDWQFPDLSSKLTSKEAFRFDDNRLTTNYVFHPFAGTIHYAFTRANGFGVLPSFAAAAASSAVYELVLEWRELVSINDLMVTPFGGTAMGEFFYQLNNYINSEPPPGTSHAGVVEAVHGGAGVTLGLPSNLHQRFDRPAPPPSVPRDNLGLSSAYAHKFRVLLAVETIETPGGSVGPLLGGDLDFILVAMPGFLKVGRYARWFTNGNFTSFSGRFLFAPGAHDTELTFDSHLFGRYEQNLSATATGKRGYANEMALGVALNYANEASDWHADAYGIVHLLKPSERVWLALGPLQLHLAADISADFASIHSLSYDTVSQLYGEQGMKSSLQRHRYAHSYGASGRLLAAVATGGLELGARARYGHYESIEGVDREQDDVVRDPHGTEDIFRLAGYLRAEPPRSIFSGKVELGRDARRSTLAGLVQQRATVRFMSSLGFQF